MSRPNQVYAFFAFVFASHAFREVDTLNYASFDSGDGNFKLQWAYNNNKLFFNMTCKTTGWCAVGFTTTADGKNMVNYDMAVAGVASNTPYVYDYWSSSVGPPPKDSTQNFNLIKASEAGGYTNVEFDRDATTADSAKDVQFTSNTQVRIVWALHSSSDADSSLSKHTLTGVSTNRHNLIAEAMSAGIQPSSTMMMSSTSSVSTTAAPTPTTKSATGDSVESTGGDFKLHWTYSNSKLFFNMTCKTTGWCAVGFTTTADGKNMVNYNIVVAGVASDTPYLDHYWSTTMGTPTKESTQNFSLKKASEAGGYTNVEFERDATTGDNAKDVPFQSDTEVKIVWALQNSADGNVGLTKHSSTGILPNKYKLIKEAMSATSAPLTTTKNEASMAESSFMVYAILAFTACILSL